MGTAADDPILTLVMRHQALATDTIAGKAPDAERAALIGDIVAVGAAIPPGAGRDTLRNMLFFWAGDQASRGERPRDAPPPALAPYAGAETAAPGIAQPVVVPRPGAPRPAPPLVTEASSSVSTLVGAEDRARAILRIAALARQWQMTADPEAQRGYLLTGKALAEASGLADEDPDVAALVKASTIESALGQRRRRQAWIGIATIVALAIAGPLLVYLYARARASDARAAVASDVAELRQIENTKLIQANADGTRIREQMQNAARAAVDALGHNDLAPLNGLLMLYGGATQAELSRLQLVATAGTAATEVTAKAPPRNAEVKARAVAQAPSGATCNGYLWFGSAADSGLADRRDPTTLKSGDVVTLDSRADIRLRAEWPAPDTYAMSPQKGVVPAGATVTLAGLPKVFPRPSKPVWAPVTVPRAFCTTVFLQYAGDAGRSASVLATLRDLDVQTPAAEAVASAKGLAEVRCFWPDDEPVARQVAAVLGSFAPSGSLKVVPLFDFPTKPSPGTIEVWLDLTRAPAGLPGGARPDQPLVGAAP